MRTKWYVDAEIDRYSIPYFERCLRDICNNFGISELKKTGRMETDGFYHKSEFFFPGSIDEESFDEMLNDLLASGEPDYYQGRNKIG